MKREKTKFKHIYRRTITHEYGTYNYFIVHINRNNRQMYLGCDRKIENCEKILLNYARENNINENQLLR